jgi:hypothetical protein
VSCSQPSLPCCCCICACTAQCWLRLFETRLHARANGFWPVPRTQNGSFLHPTHTPPARLPACPACLPACSTPAGGAVWRHCCPDRLPAGERVPVE